MDCCYATGRINGIAKGYYRAGGLVGRIDGGGQITNCFFDWVGTGQMYAWYNIFFGKEKTAESESMRRIPAEMCEQSTYEGWDFDAVWVMPEDGGLPVLR